MACRDRLLAVCVGYLAENRWYFQFVFPIDNQNQKDDEAAEHLAFDVSEWGFGMQLYGGKRVELAIGCWNPLDRKFNKRSKKILLEYARRQPHLHVLRSSLWLKDASRIPIASWNPIPSDLLVLSCALWLGDVEPLDSTQRFEHTHVWTSRLSRSGAYRSEFCLHCSSCLIIWHRRDQQVTVHTCAFPASFHVPKFRCRYWVCDNRRNYEKIWISSFELWLAWMNLIGKTQLLKEESSQTMSIQKINLLNIH